MKKSTHLLAFFISIALVAPALTQTSVAAAVTPVVPSQDQSAEDLQPKFVWGVLIKIAAKYALSYFAEYQLDKLTKNPTQESLLAMLRRNDSAHIVALNRIQNSTVPDFTNASPNTVAGEPSTPLKIENGFENYQAVHVALMSFDQSGKALGFRPVNAGFRTGERFRLRVLPTFDGILTIENINPRAERKQIYPSNVGDVVQIKAGMEIMLPLGKDDYFEFAGLTGNEQLVFNIRDLRAIGSTASASQVTRKDESNGSNFMQELAPGTFPVIVQALHLRHDKSKGI